MEQILKAITEWLDDNWLKFLTGLLLASAGWFLGQWRARRKWQKKEFLDRLNVSMNTIQDGRLLIRTVLEKSCREIFLNDLAVAAVTDASQKTTEGDPTLPLPKDDYWYYLNSVLNEVGEQFAAGQIRRDMGQNVTREAYLICLTSECAGAARTRKVRAMLVQKKLLENLPAEPPTLEAESHTTRWKTLQFLSLEMQSAPHKFIEVEICL